MKKDPKTEPLRVGLVSLGCAKNLVDAEIMLGSLLQDGIQVVNDAAQADVVIVNTCSFIDAAQEESVDTILESDALRQAKRRGQGLVVSGCLPQRFREELPKLMPEVDAFMGIDQVAQAPRIVRDALEHRRQRLASGKPASRTGRGKALSSKLAALDRQKPGTEGSAADSVRGTDKFGKTRRLVGPAALPAEGPLFEVSARPQFIPDYATPRFRLTPKHFAYLKIAEGCNHPCSFCIIPRMRGTHRSRPQPDLVREVRALVKDGVKEINLISQDSTFYGLDLRPTRSGSIAAPARFKEAAAALPAGATTLSTLLRALEAVPGDFWIRLLYTHPAHWTDDLIRTLAECRKVVRYVDMPLQHIHDNMLERMRRETSRAYIEDLIARIRAGIPGIALRTTFIVGFPGETEASFEALLAFIETTRFERLGVFTYSREDGTRAAAMAGQVPDRIKRTRRDRAMAVQQQIARAHSAARVGTTLKVLVEHEAAGPEAERVAVQASEHGVVRAADATLPALRGRWLVARGEADAPDIDGRIYVHGDVPVGRFARVRIIGHTDYDLLAEPFSG